MTGRYQHLADSLEQYISPNDREARGWLAELLAAADCGGINCGRCQQCLTVTLHFAKQALKDQESP